MLRKFNILNKNILILCLFFLLTCNNLLSLEKPKHEDFLNNIYLKKLDLSMLFESVPSEVVKRNEVYIASLLLNNSTYLSMDLKPISYDAKVPWHDLSHTYNLYLNSFNDVEILNILFESTRNKQYIEKSLYLINDWIEYENSDQSHENKYVWNDHSVAMRTLSMIHFLLLEQNDDDFILSPPIKVSAPVLNCSKSPE